MPYAFNPSVTPRQLPGERHPRREARACLTHSTPQSLRDSSRGSATLQRHPRREARACLTHSTPQSLRDSSRGSATLNRLPCRVALSLRSVVLAGIRESRHNNLSLNRCETFYRRMIFISVRKRPGCTRENSLETTFAREYGRFAHGCTSVLHSCPSADRQSVSHLHPPTSSVATELQGGLSPNAPR